MQPFLERELDCPYLAAEHQKKNIRAGSWRGISVSRIIFLLRADVWLSPALCKTETDWSELESRRDRDGVRSSWFPPVAFWH